MYNLSKRVQSNGLFLDCPTFVNHGHLLTHPRILLQLRFALVKPRNQQEHTSNAAKTLRRLLFALSGPSIYSQLPKLRSSGSKKRIQLNCQVLFAAFSLHLTTILKRGVHIRVYRFLIIAFLTRSPLEFSARTEKERRGKSGVREGEKSFAELCA
jgi:hypothetical protein